MDANLADRRKVGVLRARGEYALIMLQAVAAGEKLFRLAGIETGTPTRYSIQIGGDQHLDCSPDIGEQDLLDRYFWRFMNHSCAPSVTIAYPYVVALRDLAPWDAVTFNYNTTEWDMAEPFACRCGAESCLGEIKGFKHLTKAQIDQLPAVAPYLG
ncbi:SET domain-containing protein-lysine N-methyltransferase [Sphingomonas sp.]|uniref:SET domain-containing protein-lysine N-methyltransferase n=1 Tax=Sphingomonas sp. TaxID=28214 RepID=UPI001DE561D6|nr:SET domain-containing protein-lysine N-methyltransferase [Sphingomonas sp.]MBX9796793.1 hypothetical protein [Sphingomonas sp.]